MPCSYAPELAQQPHAFRERCMRVRSVIIPPSVALDAATLQRAPQLRIVGRLSAGAENIDIEACARAGIEVVRPASASAAAEAEFVIGALLQMLRRVPIIGEDGLLVGRELGGLTVGLVGMTATVKPLQQLLQAFGARVAGLRPGGARLGPDLVALEVSSRWGCASCCRPATPLRAADLLPALRRPVRRAAARPSAASTRCWVSLAHSSLFDEARAGAGAARGAAGRRLVRQPGARRAGSGPAAAPHRHPAGHAACQRHHPAVARAQRLGGGAAHRRVAAVGAAAARLQAVAARRAC